MNTADIFVDVFKLRTEGKKASFKIVNLTLDAVKIVLKGEIVKFGTPGTKEDLCNGFLKQCHAEAKNCDGYNGYYPTAKGYKAILSKLS